MECIFAIVPFNPVSIEPTNIAEIWPRFTEISFGCFILSSPLVPCTMSTVSVKVKVVLKLFSDDSK